MFPLCLLAKIEVYIINHNKNIYFLGKRIMLMTLCLLAKDKYDKYNKFPLCFLLAKIEVYMINDNKNIYFLGIEANE